MSILSRFGGGGDRRLTALASAAARMLQAYATQVETLRRLRHGSSKFVPIEHVHVIEGGKALIGNVNQKDPIDLR